MSFFTLKITGDDNPIETTDITAVEIFLDTVDNNVQNKSSGMLAKLEIKGDIKQGQTATFIELFK